MMSIILETYKTLERSHTLEFERLQKRSNLVSFGRLAAVISFFIIFYYWLTTENVFYIFTLLGLSIVFTFLVRFHLKLSFLRKMQRHLADINKEEHAYLLNNALPFKNGVEYINPKHPYTYDLDIFGDNSLFQHLNRAATHVGNKTLAKTLCTLLPDEEILLNHEAVKELQNNLQWRQHVLALAKETNDSKASYDALIKWSAEEPQRLPKAVIYLSYILPAAFAIVLALSIITNNEAAIYASELLFVCNVLLAGSQFKKIKKELVHSSNIDKIIKNYSLIFEKIENENFESHKLKSLQNSLKTDALFASNRLKSLSYLFSQLETVQNLLAALVLNGLMLYHLHFYRKLSGWKLKFAHHIPEWLQVIGTFESLNSLSNFGYNNPSFAYPNINKASKIEFKNLGHPLIRKEKRVNNDVNFTEHPFIILTGSNMSGKSTFLRSLGINMILTGAGAPVCAAYADVCPMDVWVSMRLSDSLTDNESYFYAEIKRLKEIIDAANEKTCFVLLDEILRGTNSDDKRTGTVEMIKNIIAKNIVGAIATHDLDVCNIVAQRSEKLTNKCFESETIDNELYFDYKLRNGICKNRNATFLMKKIGIIAS